MTFLVAEHSLEGAHFPGPLDNCSGRLSTVSLHKPHRLLLWLPLCHSLVQGSILWHLFLLLYVHSLGLFCPMALTTPLIQMIPSLCPDLSWLCLVSTSHVDGTGASNDRWIHFLPESPPCWTSCNQYSQKAQSQIRFLPLPESHSRTHHRLFSFCLVCILIPSTVPLHVCALASDLPGHDCAFFFLPFCSLAPCSFS